MFNVDSFRSNIEKNGYLQNNRFKVTIAPPNTMQGVSNNIPELLTFRAESVKAPGITLQSSDVFRHGIGVKQAMPFSGAYTDNVISFISDGRGDIWSFWYLWINSIFDFGGADNVVGVTNKLPTYELEYKEKYSTKITIEVFDNYGNVSQTINMYDAFPISINDMQLNWGNNNQLLRITVGLSFKEMTIEGAGFSTPEQGVSTVSTPPSTVPPALFTQGTSLSPTTP